MNPFSKENREKRKLKRADWKKYKKEKRQMKRASLKEEYANAPVLTRFFHVNAHRIIVTLIWAVVVLSVLGIILTDEDFIAGEIYKHLDKVDAKDVPQEEIYALSPIDEDGAKRISKLPENGADDTWTFCVYFVGANLEDMHENDLSSYVCKITSDIAAENSTVKNDQLNERLGRYASEVNENGLDLPEYLYKIDKPVASSSTVTEEVIVANKMGAASADISEMVSNELPENITIVVQTGGATRWSNTLVNPNKTQRFVIKNGIISEVENMHIQDSCDPNTLSDFISYCAKNYESDHMGLILWDHGGGVTGYGLDSIFNSEMTLADLQKAISKPLKKDVNDPYFDIIGFDACLMASTEAASVFDGYGKYLAASEEVMPGDGLNYSVWLNTLAENPTMNAAEVCREITDSYIDFHMKRNLDSITTKVLGNTVVTFSVVDIHKAAMLNAAYEKMNEKLLKLAVNDKSVITDMSRAASKTMRYSKENYDYYNTIDLGTYVDYLSETYPDECEEVRKLLREAVLYKRGNSFLKDSQGLSIYFPISMGESYGLYIFTDYIYNISKNKCTNALYYYKVAGCLNDELQKTVLDVTGKSLPVLNTQLFYDYQMIEPTINDNEIVINIGDDLSKSIQDVYLETACYDEVLEKITYYGTDNCYDFDGEGNIVATVDGQWFALDGSLLKADISFSTDETSTYIAKVIHNGVLSLMTFTYDNNTGDIVINSVSKMPGQTDGEYDPSFRINTELIPGDTIIPILTEQDAYGQEQQEANGKKVKYKASSKIQLINLPDGDYVQSVVVTDMRGDSYYSPVVEAHFKNGKASDLKVTPEFVGRSN